MYDRWVSKACDGGKAVLTAGVACLAVLSADSLAVLATHCHTFETDVAYQPGFLGFREVPAYLTVWEAAQVSSVCFLPPVHRVEPIRRVVCRLPGLHEPLN